MDAQQALFRPPCWILAIPGQCPITNISTHNFGSWSTKLGGTVQTTKKNNDNGPGPGRNYRETDVFAFCRKTAQIAQSGLFGPKNAVFWPEVILCGQLKINCYNHDGTPKRLPFGVDCIARRSLGGRPCLVGAQNWPENPI